MPPNSVPRPADSLANMRAQGVRSLWVVCELCHHEAVMNVDRFSAEVPVPAFGPRMVCTSCGIIGAFARPNWQERQAQETLTGLAVALRGQMERSSIIILAALGLAAMQSADLVIALRTGRARGAVRRGYPQRTASPVLASRLRHVVTLTNNLDGGISAAARL